MLVCSGQGEADFLSETLITRSERVIHHHAPALTALRPGLHLPKQLVKSMPRFIADNSQSVRRRPNPSLPPEVRPNVPRLGLGSSLSSLTFQTRGHRLEARKPQLFV